MRVERFEVLLRNERTMQTVKRAWNKDELLKSVVWLKRMNARGSDVFVRPIGQHGLILVDALNAENVAAMRQKGFEPAVTIECAPGVFQAWVMLSTLPISDHVRQLAAAGLAKAVNASAPVRSSEGYGCLAGLTNSSSKSESRMKRRYALAHEEHRGEASSGAKYLEHIQKTLRDLAKAKDRTANPRSRGKELGRGR